ncbi:MAG: xylulokinase [Acholeplasmatales bacterium]|nr:xylulokinase [Acholeplasmatales bacterium]
MYIGLDLGTSSLKGLLIDEKTNIIKSKSVSYNVSYPKPLYSEQNPLDWLNAVKEVLKYLSQGIEDDIKGISIAGQMHGLVLIDENDNVLRPCILWNDGRSKDECNYLNNELGIDLLKENTANIAFAGFTLPKLLWVYNNEREIFNKINKIMLPKDFIIYSLTGKFVSDYSDSAGTLYLDVKNKCYSKYILDLCHIKESWLPKLCESFDIISNIKPEYNLKNAKLICGGADNAMAAVGSGVINDGDVMLSLGTSGTVLISSDKFINPKNPSMHSFNHSNGKFLLLGCILEAASAYNWFIKDILNIDFSVNINENMLGENKVYFLPYLMGERTPHNDMDAKGSFIGLTPVTSKEDMSLSVLEGVAFALNDSIEIARKEGIRINSIVICGGGSKNPLWCKIISNVLDVNVYKANTEEGPSYGAALLSYISINSRDVNDIKSLINYKLIEKPDNLLVEKYKKKYQTFKKMYPALKDIFKEL